MLSDTEVVMFDSSNAAKPHTMEGWLSRNGHFYQDERAARYSGCTHCPCEDCGQPALKMYVRCETCRMRLTDARYETRPEAPWNGVQMIYSETREEYYSSPDEAEDELEDGETLKLVLCEPQYARQLESDDFDDDLPEDGEAPDELLEAVDVFNEAVSGVILSWYPGKFRLRIEGVLK